MKQKNRCSTSCARVQIDWYVSPRAQVSASAHCDVTSRSLMLSPTRDGRRRERECFQTAPSLEKIKLPSRGMKVAQRACIACQLGCGECIYSGFYRTYRSYFEFLGKTKSATAISFGTYYILFSELATVCDGNLSLCTHMNRRTVSRP